MNRGPCEQSSHKPHPDESGTALRRRRGCRDRTAVAPPVAVTELASRPLLRTLTARRRQRLQGFGLEASPQTSVANDGFRLCVSHPFRKVQTTRKRVGHPLAFI